MASKLGRAQGAIVIWGGTHPTLFPEQVANQEFVDIVIQGFGAQAFGTAIRSISQGRHSAENVVYDGRGVSSGVPVTLSRRPGGSVQFLPDLGLVRDWALHRNADVAIGENEVTILQYQDTSGTLVRYARCLLDHLISDGISLRLLEDELTGALQPVSASERGSYRDWVTEQSEKFPRSDSRPVTPARQFWLGHLDGAQADRSTPLPFATSPAAPRCGLLTVLYLDGTVSAAIDACYEAARNSGPSK